MSDHSAERKAILALHLSPVIGPRRFARLVGHFGSARATLEAPLSKIASVPGITPAVAQSVRDARDPEKASLEMEKAEKLGARIITCIDPEYPAGVRILPDYPPVLYVRGEIKAQDDPAIAIVGTRRPTAYGKNAASHIARDLAAMKITTVSGLARGIDTEAHEATLAAGGRTIAVLGNGLNHHYPPENRTLEDGIAASGALVTEFPLDAVPDRAHFPRRNRIIAALSIATAVIEADVKSGALITASFALEQGKEVFAVPGPVFSRMSSGPHFLIKSGAPCIESAQDIVSALPSLAGRLRPARAKAGGSAPSGTEGGEILAALEDETEGLSIDALGERLALSSGEIAFGLLDLELKGLVRCLPGKIYVLVR